VRTRALIGPLALLVLAPVSVYVSLRGELDEHRRSYPTDVVYVAAGTSASYGPATWRLDWQRSADDLRTAEWVAPAPGTGRWVLARITYRADRALPGDGWCEVAFVDEDGRRFDPELGTTIDGRTSRCDGDQNGPATQRPTAGKDFSFVVAALVPRDAQRLRPRVTIRAELPRALEFG
jgi:hypothetical protein